MAMDEEFSEESIAEQDNGQKPDDGHEISADLIRGHINTIILRTLYERDKYGYEIIDEIEKKSHGQYTLKQPTLYSALKRLENQGYIKAYWKTDEVSSGGRRKYFTLTELGREFSEKNQSEWEYSRTVIDSLISDKPFDFSKPAPTDVDFNLLRRSVTRVPTGEKPEQSEQATQPRETKPTEQSAGDAQAGYRQAYVDSVVSTPARSEYSQQTTTEVILEKPNATRTADSPMPSTAADTRSEEERRIAHENFLKLVSAAPAPSQQAKPKDENIVPHSDEIDTDKLIYNYKPETERDYKTLVNLIFNKAVKGPTRSQSRESSQQNPPQASSQVNFAQSRQTDAILDKAKADGLKINTSNTSSASADKAAITTYNQGKTLFICSVVVGLILALESVVCILFKDTLEVSLIYPFAILAIGVVQFVVFGVMAIGCFGKNSAIPTQSNYLTVCTILSIIAILIICLVGFLLNVNVQSVTDVLVKLVIPSVVALNLPVFALLFYIQIRIKMK